jgi:general stress protein 26
MDETHVLERSRALVERSEIALVGSNGEDGYPNVKAMLNERHEGLERIWLSTNTSSRRVGRFRTDGRACVYYFDAVTFEGLLMVGDMEVLTDPASRRMLWRDGFEEYYPKGVDDPDYSVLSFTTRWINYYHGFENTTIRLGAE